MNPLIKVLGCQRKMANRIAFSLCLLFSGVLFSTEAAVAEGWQQTLETSVSKLLANLDPQTNIFVEQPTDAAREAAYFPFLETVQSVIKSSALASGQRILQGPLQADYYLRTGFQILDSGMLLTPALIEAASGTLFSTTVVDLPAVALPSSWKRRALRDIAHELAAKLARNRQVLFHSNLPVVIEELTGGNTEEDHYVSEFAITMRGYIREELGRFGSFRPMTVAAGQSGNLQPYRLKGHYQLSGASVILRLVLLDSEHDQEIANVSSRFGTSVIPSGLTVLPPNQVVAAETHDPVQTGANISANTAVAQSSTKTSQRSPTQLTLWTNKEDRVYYNDDPLVVYLRPSGNLYARVYYVQSDGAVCEIFPIRSGNGYLRAGEIHSIGESGSNVELTISDETVGQEAIKVFTSSAPIDDSGLPKEFIDGPNVFCMVDDYGTLARGLTRALKKTARVRPTAELKILVSTR